MTDLLGVFYGAAVLAEGTLHAEWWRPIADGDYERGTFSTVIVFGDHFASSIRLRLMIRGSAANSHFSDLAATGDRRLRIPSLAQGDGLSCRTATGVHGFRHVTVFDDDMVEQSNL